MVSEGAPGTSVRFPDPSVTPPELELALKFAAVAFPLPNVCPPAAGAVGDWRHPDRAIPRAHTVPKVHRRFMICRSL
jgi:hypothetical protein